MEQRDLLAKEIKLARMKKKLTQHDLAKLTGLSNATIVNIEKNKRKANMQTILKVCETLNIPNKKIKTFL